MTDYENFIRKKCGQRYDNNDLRWEPINEETDKCIDSHLERLVAWGKLPENQKINRVYIENEHGRNAMLAFGIIFLVAALYSFFSDREWEGRGFVFLLFSLILLIIYGLSKDPTVVDFDKWIEEEKLK